MVASERKFEVNYGGAVYMFGFDSEDIMGVKR